MFGAKLGYLQATVAQVNHLLMNTLYLVAHHYGITLIVGRRKLMQLSAALSLLNSIYLVTLTV